MCNTCKIEAENPLRFKMKIGTGDLRFKQDVQVDTKFLRGRPVPKMVYHAKHFCAESFLKSQSSAEVWEEIRLMWSLVYIGPPNV